MSIDIDIYEMKEDGNDGGVGATGILWPGENSTVAHYASAVVYEMTTVKYCTVRVRPTYWKSSR